MSHEEDTDLNNYSILCSAYILNEHVSCEHLLTAITASEKEDSTGGEEGARLPGKGA